MPYFAREMVLIFSIHNIQKKNSDFTYLEKVNPAPSSESKKF